ncbi:MAG TPA: ABC transporter permease, partial [Puia sp.]|nr:ABC transporter permease [Puia sp.]
MLINHLRTAYRNLKRHKIYSFINVFGLAVSLAACWLIVLYITDELGFDRFNIKADRIVRVAQHESWDGGNMNIAVTPAPLAPRLKQQFPQIEDAVRIDAEGGDLVAHGNGTLKIKDIISADPSFFKIFSFDFLEGSEETALKDPQSIVITESLAHTLFGSQESFINQVIVFPGGNPARVSAVISDIPSNSHLRFSAVRPMPSGLSDSWQNSSLYTYLLLKDPESLRSLRRLLPAFAEGTIRKEMGAVQYQLELQPLTSIHLQSNLDYEISPNSSLSRIYIFSAIGLLILFIAIINYVNLATARASSRVKEIGIRKTLGSGRWQLTSLFITEAALVTLLAGLTALVLIRFSMPVFNLITGKNLTLWQFGIWPSIAFIVLFSVVVGMISGIYPSLLLSRFQAIPALKGDTGKMGGTVFFRKSLLVLQFVITVFMISASFIIYKQLGYVNHADLGFNKQQVVTFHIDNKSLRSRISVIKSKLLQNPLIEKVAVAGNPIGNNDLGKRGYYYENNQQAISPQTKSVQELMVDADYLTTMQIGLKEGRNFSDNISTDLTNAVLVNETMVKELGWTNALGKKMISMNDKDGPPKTVVGVIKDFHTYSFQHKVEPLVLVMPPNTREQDNLYVRLARGKTNEAMAYLEQTYKSFDPGNNAEYHFLDQNFANQYESEQKQGNLSLLFTVLAVILSLVGLFGLVSFTVQQLTKEIGIRKVLGASLFNIVQLLSGNYLKLVAIAACIALPVSWFVMDRWLSDFAYRIPLQIGVFIAAGCLCAILAVLTLGIQGLKAALVNPIKSLRTE